MLVRIFAFVIAVTLAAYLTLPQVSAARGDRWSLVATSTLDPTANRTTIDLQTLAGSFMAFRLRAAGGDVRFSALSLNYSDGTSYRVDRNFELSDGERTKVLDFDRGGRFIDSITVGYDVSSSGVRGAPKLEIHALQSLRGRRAERPADVIRVAANGPPPLPISVAELLPEASGGLLIGAGDLGTAPLGAIEVRERIGKFDRVRLQVRKHDVYLDAFTVTYEDGTTATHEIDLHIPEGRTSDWVGIDGSRFIKSIAVKFHANPDSEGQAQIEVLGELADGWLKGEGAKFNDGWMLLGARKAGFAGFDTSIIPLGEHVSGFSKIRIMVHDRAITLNQLRVIYGNGNEDIIPVRARIEGGSAFGPIDLRKASRRIREIQAHYRSRFIDREARGNGKAIVEVWARR